MLYDQVLQIIQEILAHKHTHKTLRERKHWKRLVSMKISDTLSFFKTTPLFYQPLPFHGKNLTPPFFKTFENSLSPIIKGGGGGGFKYDCDLYYPAGKGLFNVSKITEKHSPSRLCSNIIFMTLSRFLLASYKQTFC